MSNSVDRNQGDHMQTKLYGIAGLQQQLTLPAGVDVDKALPSFSDFALPDTEAPIILINDVSFADMPDSLVDSQLLTEESLVWGDHFQFRESATHYYTLLRTQDGAREWKMRSTKDFSQNAIFAIADEIETSTVLSWLLMVTFAQCALHHSTLLIHASVVEREGFGVAFLGKSGTGKSTHSRLWQTFVPRFQLLNDDNPAIQVDVAGDVWIYGTPWSGKTACYRNLGVRLQAVVRLSQAKENVFAWKKGKEALITLLPSGSALRWNNTLFAAMTSLFQRIQERVPIGHLACLPDADAALLCYTTVEKEKTNYLRHEK